jgi:hypothetical protein
MVALTSTFGSLAERMNDMKYFHTDDIWESLANEGRAEVELYYTDVAQFRKELNAEAVEEGVSLRYNTFDSYKVDNTMLKIYLRPQVKSGDG